MVSCSFLSCTWYPVPCCNWLTGPQPPPNHHPPPANYEFWRFPETVQKTPKISMPPKQPLDSLPGPLETHLGSPGLPRDPNWCQNGAKMHPKTGPTTLPQIKMPIVSKTHYLLCFNHILMVPRAFKICFFPSQFPPRLLWPPFGHQGDLKKRLR